MYPWELLNCQPEDLPLLGVFGWPDNDWGDGDEADDEDMPVFDTLED
jgi:hypothetical protein